MARPRLTPEVHQRFIQAVAAGTFPDTAARFAGVSPSVMRGWLARGRAESEADEDGELPLSGPVNEGSIAGAADSTELIDPRFINLYRDFETAEASCEIRVSSVWAGHFSGSWQSCSKWLSSRFAAKWSERENIHTVNCENIHSRIGAVAVVAPAAGLSLQNSSAREALADFLLNMTPEQAALLDSPPEVPDKQAETEAKVIIDTTAEESA
jgi:hypothetical protein